MTTRWPVAVATHAARDIIGRPPPGDFGHWEGLDRFLAYARETGFDGIDVSTSLIDGRRDDRWWSTLAAAVSAAGLEIASINCLRSSLADRDYWGLAAARIRRALIIADALDIPSVNVSLAVPPERLDANAHRQLALPPGSSKTCTEEELDRTAEQLQELADLADSLRTRLVVELHHCSVADTADSVLALLKRVGRPLAVNPDVVNELWAFDRVLANWRDTLTALAPVSGGIWHVKNCRRTAVDGRVEFVDAPLGEGDVDYAEAVSVMQAAGFEGWLSIERSGPGDFLATAAQGIAFLHSRGISSPGSSV